jgi:hypothetical protein
MDDPEDFKKRSRTGSPYENPTSHPTYGQPKGEHLTATRAVIATPDWLCGRLLRDALDIAESTRARPAATGSAAGAFRSPAPGRTRSRRTRRIRLAGLVAQQLTPPRQ